MDREALLKWLQIVFHDLLEVAGIPDTDTPDGLGFALDQVEAIYAEQPGLNVGYAKDLASWFLLERIHAALLSVSGKVSVDGDTFEFTRQLDGIEAWMNRLLARIGWIVHPVEEVQSDVGKVVTIRQPYTWGSADEW